MRKLSLPLTEEIARSLKMGEEVLLSGVVYTARDAAHERMEEHLEKGLPLPFDPMDATIYYVGPSPAKPGHVIGSAGPTTAGRMDKWAPRMIALGARGMIGKGARSKKVVEAMKKHGGVYFGAIGGAGALLAHCIVENTPVAYEDLGPEAVHRLVLKDFPAVVLIDSEGNDLYEEGRKEYLKTRHPEKMH